MGGNKANTPNGYEFKDELNRYQAFQKLKKQYAGLVTEATGLTVEDWREKVATNFNGFGEKFNEFVQEYEYDVSDPTNYALAAIAYRIDFASGNARMPGSKNNDHAIARWHCEVVVWCLKFLICYEKADEVDLSQWENVPECVKEYANDALKELGLPHVTVA
ncbi:MAG: hypothetical protein ACOX3T_04725 [Bdellovibrionota bacterium]